MDRYPHHYAVRAPAQGSHEVLLSSDQLPPLQTAPPTQFGGPGDLWSPETLLLGALTDCFILTFRAMASASHVEWKALSADADGTLDRVDGVTRFTEVALHAHLTVPADVDIERAQRLLTKAEKGCLIRNSLTATVTLTTDITKD